MSVEWKHVFKQHKEQSPDMLSHAQGHHLHFAVPRVIKVNQLSV